MGREKVQMEFITDPKKRRFTFRNRKESIVKKVSELSNLCDVNVALIIYNDQHQTPQIFPPDIDKFNNVIDFYQKNRRSHPAKIRPHDLITKNDFLKAKKKKSEGKYPTWFDFLNGFTEGSLREFASGLEVKVDKVKARIESIKKPSKIQNLETNPGNTVIILDDVVENPGPITSMISPNTDDYNKCGFFLGDQNPIVENSDLMMSDEDFKNLGIDFDDLFPGDQNPNVDNCDLMMSDEDYKNLGIDLDELFSDKDGSVISNVLMGEKHEDDKFWFDDKIFSLETDPLPGFCFSPEIMPLQQNQQQPEFCQEIMVQQQPEFSSCCMEMKEFAMPSLPSHVMEYVTGSDYYY